MLDFNDSAPIDEATIRDFIGLIHDYVRRALNGAETSGVLEDFSSETLLPRPWPFRSLHFLPAPAMPIVTVGTLSGLRRLNSL